MFNFAKKQQNTLLPDQYSRAMNDVIAVLSFIISLLLTIALFTYNDQDNCWSKVGNINIYHNRLGKFGAYVSDFFYYNLGYCAWLIVAIIFYFGYKTIISRENSASGFSTVLRLLVSILLIVTGSLLEYICSHTQINNALGKFLFYKLIVNFGDLGVAMLTIILFFISAFYFFDFSWLQCADLLGKLIYNLTTLINRKDNIIKPTTVLDHKRAEFKTINEDDEEIFIKEYTQELENTIAPESKKKNLVKTVNKPNIKNKLLPPISLLNNVPSDNNILINDQEISQVSNEIESFMNEFGISLTVCSAQTGPVITRYEIIPPKGLKGSKIVELNKDIARSLSKESVRIVENIRGKNTMGLEIPNKKRQTIFPKEIFDSTEFHNSNSPLTLGIGKSVSGDIVVTDLAKMPHLLVAGTTGSGKSVAINGMILSILYKATVNEVKFIMIDPKMVELTPYQDMPHLLMPVIINVEESVAALQWAVAEMEKRYLTMSKLGVRHINDYNNLWVELNNKKSPSYQQLQETNSEFLEEVLAMGQWPFIVIIIDELADLMDQVGKKVEKLISRLAQKARAIGIHLIIATQRPDATVVTGLIKANIPARISFQLRSETDYRIILGQSGGGSLLGSGDMLFLGPASSILLRAHGPFVTDKEIHQVVDYLKKNNDPVNYIELNNYCEEDYDNNSEFVNNNNSQDALHSQVLEFIVTAGSKKCSISALQTAFGIGYNRAARIMNSLEKQGIVRRNEKGSFELLKT
jgi:S-DNA-T family DNA segregation ATPase FtsK/SpoIIIE